MQVRTAEDEEQIAPRTLTRTRVAGRRIFALIGGLVAVDLLLPQVGQAHATVDALHHVRWGWLVAAGGTAAATYLMAAVSLLGAANERLPLGRTWGVQVAAAFTNRITPAGIGGMRTNVRYLEASGTSRPAAVAAVGLNTVAGFLVHLAGLLAIVPLLGAGGTHLHFRGPDLGDNFAYLIGALGILVGAGIVRRARVLTRKLAPPVRTAASALVAVVRRPVAAAALFGGSAGVTLAYALALAACTRAFGLGLGLPAVIAIFLGGSAVGSVSVTPGGLGALEGALVAGLTAAGAASGPAIAAVLTYRLVTYWLPIIPGFIAFRVLRRNGRIGRLEDVKAHIGSTRSLQGVAISMRRVPHTRRSDMERIKKNKLAAGVAGVLALFGLGAGVATASNGSAQPATVRVQPAAVTSVTPPVDTPASSAGQPAPAADKAEPGGADNDNVQEGDQNGPDDANEANDANDPKEKEGTEAPDNGKEDAPGQKGSQGQSVPSQGVM